MSAVAWALAMTVAMATPLDDDEAFSAGRALYQQLEFEEALIRFQEVSLGEERSDEERALAFVWTGLAYAQLGRFDQAAESFERGVRADPKVALPEGVSPKIAKVFESAAARARKATAAEQAQRKAEEERLAKQAAEDEAKRKAAEAERARVKAEAEEAQRAADAKKAEQAAAPAEDAPSSTTQAAETPHPSMGTTSGAVEEPPEASGFGLSMAYWAGAATGGVIGGALAAGGVGLFASSYIVFTIAAAPTTPQLAAAQALTLANGLWFASIGVVAIGGLALAAGATSATLAVLQAE